MVQHSFVILGITIAIAGCGGSGPPEQVDPTSVHFGDTALVVVVNPVINDLNRQTVAMPGGQRSGIVLRSDDGVSDTTDEDGIAVLAPLTPGPRTLTVTGGGLDSTFGVMLADGALHEVAIASTGDQTQIMVDLDYKSDQVFEVLPTMTNAEVNAALQVSDRVVFVRGGTYTGDLEFSGSRVTLFGEGALGGSVVLQGSMTVSGSDSRIRGARITGDLTIPASGTGVSFSRIDGTITATGSDTTVLANALCGAATVTGSGTIVIGNIGTAPAPACP